MKHIELLAPRFESIATPQTVAKPLPIVKDLKGKRVAFLEQWKPRFSEIYDRLAVLLKEEQGIKEVVEVRIPMDTPASPQLLDEIAQQVDVAIVGFAQ